MRVLAHLLRYPEPGWLEHLPELDAALQCEPSLTVARKAELRRLMQALTERDLLDVQGQYVEVFDQGRSTSLYLFEHVHGDSRERGPAMIDLLQTYEQAGLYLGPGELPDHLPVLLEFASTQPVRQAQELLREISHIARSIFSALLRRHSPYASVLGAVLEMAGEKAEAVVVPPDPDIDASWAEPAAFGDCSPETARARGQEQAIHIVRKGASLSSGAPS